MKKIILFLLILCTACRKEPPVPGKPLLAFPQNNEVCAEGLIISVNLSTVLFQWEAAANTDTYVLNIKNLESGQIQIQTTDKTRLEVPLERGLAYSWSILSKNTNAGTEMSSDTWKFYNPGSAQTSYSPFPADLLAPRFGEVIPASVEKVSLKWSAADPDGDIDSYDVYLGISTVPVLYKTAIKETQLADLILDRNKTYYWKIITRDTKSNRSVSDVYIFKLD